MTEQIETKQPARLRCVGSRTRDCREGKTIAYFLVARQRPCGHYEPPIPLCRDCIDGKNPHADVHMVLGQAKRATRCTTCGVPSRLLAMLVCHYAVPVAGSGMATPLCRSVGVGVVIDAGSGRLVQYDAKDVPLTQGHTLLRDRVTCRECRELMHA